MRSISKLASSLTRVAVVTEQVVLVLHGVEGSCRMTKMWAYKSLAKLLGLNLTKTKLVEYSTCLAVKKLW
jgi:hypothetical protein